MSLIKDDGTKPITKFHYPGFDYIDIESAYDYLDSFDTLAVDLETSSFNPASGQILGIVIAVNEEESYY